MYSQLKNDILEKTEETLIQTLTANPTDDPEKQFKILSLNNSAGKNEIQNTLPIIFAGQEPTTKIYDSKLSPIENQYQQKLTK